MRSSIVILKSLKLQNFKKYAQKSFEFGDGLIGIIGKNGSGKSTIFEAILFSLYGEFKNKKELLRHSAAPNNATVSVELEFEYDGIEYRVIRELKGAALTPYAMLKNATETLATGTAGVNNYITKLIKIDKNAFLHTVFSSQKELTALGELRADDRKKLVRKLLGFDKIDAIEKILAEKLLALKSDINSIEKLLLSTDEIEQKNKELKDLKDSRETLNKNLITEESSFKDLNSKIDGFKKELKVLQETREKKTKLENELKIIDTRIASNNLKQETLKKELVSLGELQKHQEKLEPLKQEYEKLQSELKNQQKLKEIDLKKEALKKEQTELTKQLYNLKNEILDLETKINELQKLEPKRIELQTNLKKIKEELQKLQSDIDKIKEDLSGEQKIKKDLESKVARIIELGRESNCPVCTRSLLDEYDNVIATLTNEIKRIQEEKINGYVSKLNELNNLKSELENQKDELEKYLLKIEKELAILETKKASLQKTKETLCEIEKKEAQNKKELDDLSSYNYDKTVHDELLKKEKELKPKYDEFIQIKAKLERIPIINNELHALNEAIKIDNNSKAQKQVELNSITYDEKAHQEKQKTLENLEKEIKTLSDKISNIRVEIATIDGKINQISSDLEKDKKQKEDLKEKRLDLADYEKIKLFLAEFKTKLNAKVAPRISEISSQLYSQITKGKYQHIEVDDEFEFFIYDEGKRLPISRFSGGEIDLANLVLRIAISKTLGEISGNTNIGFLAFDEVFGSQDDSRRSSILEAFYDIKERYRQIFLISHEADIKERFERVIEV